MSRCEFTDLDTAACAHCRPPPAEHAPELTTAARWFHAVYPGACADCGSPFTAGTPIRMQTPAGWIADCCDTPTW
ncbi:hypothetical protein [Streptomyces sp. ID05-04B]|uniref:hypothetical protein n=1 Tax=Streptomyces sp. ID05-04B TaxID=3028661 RepID=UPI0029CA6FA1|nr:hypothetical protein [Streptomyces sp. ID05-04B]